MFFGVNLLGPRRQNVWIINIYDISEVQVCMPNSLHVMTIWNFVMQYYITSRGCRLDLIVKNDSLYLTFYSILMHSEAVTGSVYEIFDWKFLMQIK